MLAFGFEGSRALVGVGRIVDCGRGACSGIVAKVARSAKED